MKSSLPSVRLGHFAEPSACPDATVRIAGCMKLDMPLVTPSNLWKQSGNVLLQRVQRGA